MSAPTIPSVARTAALAVSAATVLTLCAPPGGAAAAPGVKPGAYTSTTISGGVVLLQREGRVVGDDLVLIGRYRIHPTRHGGYVDFFPGHRVYMNPDGRGGYRGPAYLGGALVGTFTLKPR